MTENLLPVMGEMDKKERDKRVVKIRTILMALTNENNLQFASAIQNMVFKGFLDNFFLDFEWASEDKEKDKKSSKSACEEYFGKAHLLLKVRLSELQQADDLAAKQSKVRSV